MDTGTWTRGARAPGIELEVPQGAPTQSPAPAPLRRDEVPDKRIAVPAQQALLRLSTVPATRAAARTLFDHVKAGRLLGIVCMNSSLAKSRARRLGYTEDRAISTGEDAVVLLDPADLREGPPVIAFRRELDPGCGGLGKVVAQPAKLDAALLRALGGFEMWRGGIQLGRDGKCALSPIDEPWRISAGTGPQAKTTHPTLLPRLLCHAKSMVGQIGMPTQLRHRHQPRECNTRFAFADDGGVIDMLPSTMNPGFVLPLNRISFHETLNEKLRELMTGRFKHFLAKPVPDYCDPCNRLGRKQYAQQEDRVRVALVDLTGKKLCQPQYAGFGDQYMMAAGSTAKVLLLYAAHQLLFDLEQMVVIHKIRTAADLQARANIEWATLQCPPRLDWLIAASVSPAGGLLRLAMHQNLEDCLRDSLRAPGDTTRANELLMNLGFEYVASVGFMSGLDRVFGGNIRFGGAYCQPGKPVGFTDTCHVVAPNDADCTKSLREQRALWKRFTISTPFPVHGSADAFATYMTLLAQGRLVNGAHSLAIEKRLETACSFIGKAALPGTRVRATKCGDTSKVFNDAALCEREGRRWVIVLLSTGLTPKEREDAEQLIRECDRLIKENQK